MTSDWYDLWCDLSPLIECVEAINVLNVSRDAKVEELIENYSRNNLVSDLTTGALKSAITSTEINRFMEEDSIVWSPTADGKFTT